jgi:hypothetical protein
MTLDLPPLRPLNCIVVHKAGIVADKEVFILDGNPKMDAALGGTESAHRLPADASNGARLDHLEAWHRRSA